MPRNINNEVEVESIDKVSDIIKAIQTFSFSFKKVGKPESCLLPPGTVIAAANIMVTIKAATTVQEDDVSFIHFSPSFTNSLWLSVNNSRGFLPFVFVHSKAEGRTMLSTSCIY